MYCSSVGYNSYRSYDNDAYEWFGAYAGANEGLYIYSGYYGIFGNFTWAILGTVVEVLMWTLGTSDFMELAEYEE